MSLKSLKTKSDDALASIPLDGGAGSGRPARPITAPGATAFMQPTIDALSQRAKEAEAKIELYEQRLKQQPVEVHVDQLVEVSSRKRRLSDEQFAELKANLAANPLIHPIAVRRRDDGLFEVVSGHHRLAAYRALRRTTIAVSVVDIEEAKVDRSAFYANLLQPSLPDYEKYLGFKAQRQAAGMTQKAMAQEAGVAESVVSMLLSFDDLPEAVLDMIASRPDAVGMNCVNELARLTREGKGDAVAAAARLLVDGRLTQKEAIAMAQRPNTAATPKPVKPEPVKIRAGRADYCRYIASGTTLRIDFKSDALRAEAEAEVAMLLKTLAERQIENS